MFQINNIHVSELGHWCPSHDPLLNMVNDTSDLFIGLAYLVIAGVLIRIALRVPNSIAREIKVFGLWLGYFVLSCGLTHFAKIPTEYAVSTLSYLAAVLNLNSMIASLGATLYLLVHARRPLLDMVDSLREIAKLQPLQDMHRTISEQLSLQLSAEELLALDAKLGSHISHLESKLKKILPRKL